MDRMLFDGIQSESGMTGGVLAHVGACGTLAAHRAMQD